MNLIAKFGFIFLYICALYTDSILVISSKPEILSKFETIIEAKDNHTILCQGNRSLEWKTPQVQEDKRFWTKFNIESIPPVNNSYKYASKLEIINMSYPFIGFYSCHEISDINDNEESASIYLYVNDPNQLTLLVNNTILDVFMTKYQEGVIPCKPTSPDVDVELFDYGNGDRIPDVLLDNQILFRYNPLQGFITNTTERDKIFQCTFRKNVTTQNAFVKLFIEEPISHLPIPIIQNSNQDRTAVGQNLTLKCVIKMIVDNKVYFHWKIPNGKENQYRISIDDEAKMSTLTIYDATKSDSGTYFCNVTDNQQHSSNYSLDVKIFDPERPQIINSTLQDEIQINLTDPLVLYCNASGLPKPVVTWYKNDVIFQPSETHRINISGNNEKIVFSPTTRQDEGTYKCVADNKNGKDQKQQTVKFKDLTHGDYSWLFVIVALLSLVLIGTIIFIVIKFRKEKQLQRELKSLGLANFQKGAVENINPELGIDEQAELLPYDQKWEFPIDQLKLGKQLGSGAFGVVMKGLARNIVEGEAETTVAVKMVKQNADHIYIKALASELKIMVHLGKHLNVVNLLGACTKNVAKKELLVIVEFCRFGNLQHYLLKHRDNYIDQVDPKTCKIDYTIGQELFDRAYSVSSDRSNAQSPLLKYAAIALSNISNTTGSCSTSDAITLSQGEEGVVISNDSIQPDWRSNYRGDYKGTVKPICTKDLLVWAFQVARGMEYLASRKVLHGDLAARNILLAENNVIKICDFGLAKSMYKNDNYKKKGNGPLPMKWMAIESLRDRVFSTQSDVWSFGIVLWELFSLARSPYPGMDADEKLYQKLLDGYRMEPPNYAPKEIYKMMIDCWSSTPLARPSFTKLSDRLGNIVGDALRNYYIDLNDPYLAMNIQRLENGQSDYLALLNSPTPEIFSSPDYVNKMVSEEPHEDTDYLSMRPNIIFSPRMEEDAVFSFNVNNRKHLSSKDNAMERLPMLSRTSDSGYETAVQSPTTPNSFSNPSYHHIIPNVEKKEETYSSATGKIMQSPENYINMGESKKKMMSQNNPLLDSCSEKSKQTFDAHCESLKV